MFIINHHRKDVNVAFQAILEIINVTCFVTKVSVICKWDQITLEFLLAEIISVYLKNGTKNTNPSNNY